jgi:hypothetical protein
MKNWFIGKLLGFVGKKLDGYKTKIGGVGFILVGVTGIIAEIFPDQGLPKMGLEGSIGAISAGITALGLAHKAVKTQAAIKELQAPAEQPPASATPNGAIATPDVAPPPKQWDGKVPGQFP